MKKFSDYTNPNQTSEVPKKSLSITEQAWENAKQKRYTPVNLEEEILAQFHEEIEPEPTPIVEEYIPEPQPEIVVEQIAGPQGERGEKGDKGDKGDTGEKGESGPKGEQGQRGFDGAQGPEGQQGIKGDKGDAGENGKDGAQGPKGDKGVDGIQGPKGDKGDVGEQGPKGDKGDTGEQGPKGDKGDVGPAGEKGSDGAKGAKGDKGARGDKGDKGDVGEQGPKGDQGEQGPIGPQGPKGADGKTPDIKKFAEKFDKLSQDINKRIDKTVQGMNLTGGGSGSYSLNDLSDTDYIGVKSATDGQVLTFDETLGKWTAADATGGGGGGTLDTWARNRANSAYDQANTGTTLAQAAYDYANTIVSDIQVDPYARNKANGAYNQANTGTTLAQAAYDYANTITLSGISGSLQNVTQIGNTTTLGITTAAVQLNLTSGITVTQGQMAWNPADLTVDVGMANGVTLQLGQEQYIKVKASAAITNGQAVMFTGSNGEHILAAPNNMSVAGYRPEYFIGVATQDIALNGFGYITVFGKVHDVNTLAWTVGDILYADPTVVGGLTKVEPEAPNINIFVAAVTKRAGGDGHIMVRPTFHSSIDNLNDVYIDGVTNGALLSYVTANSRWEDVTSASVIEPAYNKANTASANTVTIQGVNTTQNTNIQIATNLAQSAYDYANTLTAGSTDTVARNTAGLAYNKANSANILAQAAFDKANIAPSTLVNGAFTVSMDSTGQLIVPQSTQGSITAGYVTSLGDIGFNANGNLWKFGADGTMLSPYSVQITTHGFQWPDGSYQNTAFTGTATDTYARNKANDAYDAANTAVTSGQANVGSGLITITNAYQANVGAGLITEVANRQANVGAGLITVTGAYQANVGSSVIVLNNNINNAFNQSNLAFNAANSARTLAQSAYDYANTLTGSSVDQWVREKANAAYELANTKTYTYFQNTTPTSANSRDIWINTDTGYVYENFGNTANTIWAEFGPTSGSGSLDQWVRDRANNAFNQANLAFDAANTAVTSSQANVGAGLISVTSAYQANVGSARIADKLLWEANTGAGLLAYQTTSQANVGSAIAQAQANTGAGLITEVSNRQANVGAGLITVTSAYQANVGAGLLTKLDLAGGSLTGRLNVTYTPASTIDSAIKITAANTKGGTGYADVLTLTNSSGGATNVNKWIRLTSTGELQVINNTYTTMLMSLTDSGDLTVAGNVLSSGIQSGYNGNRPAFRVYGAGTTNISATNTLTSSNFAVEYNQGSYLNAGTGIFTAPVAGLYQVNLIARYSGSASLSAIQVQRTSGGTTTTQVYLEWAGNSTAYHMGGASVVKMSAGDTLKLIVTAGTVTFDANDCWSVAYLG